MPEHRHTPVLAPEAIRALAPRPGDVAVDCTVGGGGHTRLLAQAVRGGGRIVGFDLDEGNLALGRTCVEGYLLVGAGVMQIIGSALLWKIVNIEV